MARTLRVWGGRFQKGPCQARRIVAAYTKKEAIALAEISISEMDTYWSQTHNEIELKVACEVGVWDNEKIWATDPKNYVRVK